MCRKTQRLKMCCVRGGEKKSIIKENTHNIPEAFRQMYHQESLVWARFQPGISPVKRPKKVTFLVHKSGQKSTEP